MRPFVSVCITTFSRRDQAVLAIKSALSQTYKPIEIIVVEDGSDSGIKEWIDEEQLLEVVYIKHKKRMGLATARNTGIIHAKGKYIAFLDDDDEWTDRKIEKQILLFEELDESYAIVYCGIENLESDHYSSIGRPSIRGNLRDEIVRNGLYTIPSTNVFRKSVLVSIGGLDTDLETGVDHDLWMKIASNGYYVDYVDEPLTKHISYNIPQMTTDSSKRIVGIQKYLKKWEPTIYDWLGDKKGRKYCLDYYASVIGNLGFSLVKKGSALEGRYVLWKAFIKSPKVFLLNPALLLVMVFGRAGYDFGKHMHRIFKKYAN